jgi:SAM-dependent methyltransferase
MDRSALSYWESGRAGPVRPIGPPIAPAAEDIGFIEQNVRAAAGGSGVQAMLLGVTRGIASMRWPAGSSLLAVEWSSTIIRSFWSRDGLPAASDVVRADWRQLPLASSSRDVVIGDGCYSALATLSDGGLLNAEVHRVLRPGGLFCMRCFARPARGLEVGAVFEELRAGNIASVFLLQWLLAMAVHGETREGVALDAVWRAWHENQPRPGELFARLGWPQDSAWTFERWKGVQVRYSFPTLEELGELSAPAFTTVTRRIPAYAWGVCFPTVVMRPRLRR